MVRLRDEKGVQLDAQFLCPTRIKRVFRIDKCSNQKISDLVQICMLPDGDFTESAIAGVTQNMAKLNLENLNAITFHIESVPAIPNNLTKN